MLFNCDLSASYNIGAKYFIRELQKSVSAKKWSYILASGSYIRNAKSLSFEDLIQTLKD